MAFDSPILKFASLPEKSVAATSRLGDLLIQNGALSPDRLALGLALQTRSSARLGEILIANDLARSGDVYAALEHQYRIGSVHLQDYVFSPDVVRILPARTALAHDCVVIDQSEDQMLVAVADPTRCEQITRLPELFGCRITFLRADRAQIHTVIAAHQRDTLRDRARDRCPPNFSCKQVLTRQLRATIVFAFGAGFFYLFFTGALGVTVFFWIATALIANTSFKIICLLAYLRTLKQETPERRERRQPLPKVSVMVPLYKEARILPRLTERLERLDYPKELLEILLVCEQDDLETKHHLMRTKLPFWIKAVFVPEDNVRTKPRALNYALDFCSGTIVGIYDAEDAPEPDQIFKVVQHLHSSDEEVVCVQAALDYYNARTNWISRCFTIEYAILFRVILKGLQAMRLPIPLGGTSIFFDRSVLEEIGAWDAYNVTEDADLGIRLHRLGYRCEVIESTTFEEANYRLLPWVRQRSRWLKGFILTWGSHIRRPIQLFKDLGLKGFIVFNILFIGTVSAFLSAPLVLPLWLMSFGISLQMYTFLSPLALALLIAAFVFTELSLCLLGYVATRRERHRFLTPWLPTMVLYWPLGCLAAYKALFELILRPFYWDKTQHGLNDAACQAEISTLTAPKPST